MVKDPVVKFTTPITVMWTQTSKIDVFFLKNFYLYIGEHSTYNIWHYLQPANYNPHNQIENTAKRNIKPLIFGTADMTSPYY
jgi:hypothetical protein